MSEIIANSVAMRSVMQQLSQVAKTGATVLLTGETGTGKGLLAEYLHRESHLADRPFVTVDCGTLQPSLIQSELFGHVKGAFTGAAVAHIGRFELADGGTLLLDEIGELPLETQVNLLRFLQSGEYTRLGSTRTRRVNVRIICATNQNLVTMVEEKRFRADLFFRLNVFPVHVPALRDRMDDLRELVGSILRRKSGVGKVVVNRVAPEVYERFARYSWPGNVRELENVVERALILATESAISVQDLRGAPIIQALGPATATAATASMNWAEHERRFLLKALDACGWKIKGRGNAAELTGISPSTFRDRMKRLGISRPHP
jgi:transcriptional regulator with GAF, ATPase, and Fis domain